MLTQAIALIDARRCASVSILNRIIFIGTSSGFSSECGPSPAFHSTKGALARVEDKFAVRVSDDYVANLLDIEPTGQAMRMDWFFAVWWDYNFQHSDVLILKDDLVSFRSCFHSIQVSMCRTTRL